MSKNTVSPERPIKVLINALHAKSGGGVTYIKNILPFLADDPSVDIHLCIHDSQRGKIDNPVDGVQVHVLTFQTGFWRLLVHEQWAVPKLARAIAADVVFSPANYGPLLARRHIVMLRNALGVAGVDKRPSKIAYWALLSVATVLSLLTARRGIAVSRYMVDSIGTVLARIFAGKVTVIPHGVDERFRAAPEDDRRDDFLLAVSDIYVQKNFETLLLAIEKLRQTHPDVDLRIAGQFLDPAYYTGLLEIISAKGLQENVRFLGSVPPQELRVLYRRCRAFVFPSWVESFGNPLVEAMASGAPVASSNAAAMPEVLGGAGLLFDPADSTEMAATLARIIDDEDLRSRLSAQSVRRAADFSWSSTAQKTSAVFHQAAGR